ncbi:sulfur carrier protein ThiS [Flexibacterium corallicola]|uniref:sulfur carrier protein ThiS n=1 Tax=Flexibacterium corallicola TaxID=3037259 RepID=UPI00286ED7BC|nr:sulfur carrier protein ThiS [Pseudovibrio sp. M1P-2-3]
MKIIVNGESRKATGNTLADILVEMGFTGPAIATALNGYLVPRENYQHTVIEEGDQLEVLAPMQGG